MLPFEKVVDRIWGDKAHSLAAYLTELWIRLSSAAGARPDVMHALAEGFQSSAAVANESEEVISRRGAEGLKEPGDGIRWRSPPFRLTKRRVCRMTSNVAWPGRLISTRRMPVSCSGEYNCDSSPLSRQRNNTTGVTPKKRSIRLH